MAAATSAPPARYFVSEDEEWRARKRARRGPAASPDSPPPTVDLVSGGLQPLVPVAEVQRLLLVLGGGEEPGVRWASVQRRDGIATLCVVLLSGLGMEEFARSGSRSDLLRRLCFVPHPTTLEAPRAAPWGFLYELLYRPFPNRLRAVTRRVTVRRIGAEYYEDRPKGRPGPEGYVLAPHELRQHGYPSESDNPTYCRTQPRPSGSLCPQDRRVLGLDCEMCRTAVGYEVARVTLVDSNLSVVYDELVLPDHPIEDYCTPYSGITPEALVGVQTRLPDVQRFLQGLVFDDTVLVGHSLQNDLHVLRLVHGRVIDTAVLFPHPKGPPHQPALRLLAHRHLKKSIQGFTEKAPSAAHSSVVDATTCLELLQLKVRNGPQFAAEGARQNVLQAMQALGWRVSFVGAQETLNRFTPPDCPAVPVDSPAVAAPAAAALLSATGPRAGGRFGSNSPSPTNRRLRGGGC